MAKRLLSVQKIVNLSSDPGSGTAGELYYNTTLNAYKFYNGTSWTTISSGAAAGVYVGTTAPASPSEGDLWYNSETAKLLIYYDNFWIELSGGGGSSIPDQTGNSGKYLTTNGSELSWSVVDALPSQTGNSGKYLTTNGTNATWSTASPVITLGGDLTGSATLTNLGNATLTATIAANSVELGTDTTGQYIATISGTANQIAVSASGTESVTATLSLPSSVIFPGTVTLNADPTQALHAVTKQYVDAIAEGLHIHASVGAATTANISNLSSAPSTIDGVTLTNNMRVLVKNQSTSSQNGIYVYNSSTGALTRALDFDTIAEIQGGDFVFVTGGTLNDNTGWVQTETITAVGTSPIIFQQFSGAGTYTAGTGLALNANQFSNTGVLSINGSTGVVTGIAPTNSPTFTGTVTVPTPSNSTDAATKGYVDSVAVEEVYYQANAPTSIPVGTVWIESDVDVSSTTYHAAYSADSPLNPIVGDLWVESDIDLDSFSLIPSPINQSGKYLGSDGTNYQWTIIDLSSYATLSSPSFTGTPAAPTAAVNTNTTQIATTAYVIGQGYAKLASPTFTGTVVIPTLNLTTADTSTTASHYYVQNTSDGIIRPKTLANVRTEIVTTAAVNSAAVSPTAAGSTGVRQITMSTASPTGGSDGDVWLVYV